MYFTPTCPSCYNHLDSGDCSLPTSILTAAKRERSYMGENPTPSFQRPPVIETVLGVEFAALSKWTIPHFGLYWSVVRAEFPNVEARSPLSTVSGDEGSVRVQVQQTPRARCWYINESGAELIQLQDDRFLLNWRQTENQHPYPRYHERTRPLFLEQWSRFLSFLDLEMIGQPEILQCEVSYINHILKGEGWEVAADWNKVFTVCGNLKGEKFLPDPESRRFALEYPMPNESGGLSVTATRAIRIVDGKEIIQFQLTARGRPKSSSVQDICEWLDAGHEWVVKGFTELTTPEMHKRWGRES